MSRRIEETMTMKKMTVILCAIAGLLLLAFAGCASDENFTEQSYASESGAVERIVIDVTDRELEITASEDDSVHIDYFDGEKEKLDISVSDDKRLSVGITVDKEWTDYIGFKPAAEYRKITVKIPDNTIVSLSAATTNENISISSLSLTESVSLNSNGGDVVCDRVGVGKSIDLTSKNGNITGTIVGAMDDFAITCTIKKGDCNLPEKTEGGGKSLTADCNNGDIKIEFAE